MLEYVRNVDQMKYDLLIEQLGSLVTYLVVDDVGSSP